MTLVARFISDRMGAGAHTLERRVRPVRAPTAVDRSSEPTDDELLTCVRAGDKAAFQALYRRYHPCVVGMALHRGCPEAEAEDVVHEVFMAMWRRPPKLGPVRLTTWLYRVLANQVSSLHRRRRVRRLFAMDVAEERRTLSIADEEASAVRRDLVREVLARMGPKKREVLVLFELEGHSGTEIAELVGCRTNTVWTRLHHARAEFRRLSERLGGLQEDAPHDDA